MNAAARPAYTGPAPVFLLAPARSYSTVCLALLAGHPDLYGFPEMLLFSTPDVAGLLTEEQRRPVTPGHWLRHRLTGVLRAVAELHEGSQEPAAIERAGQWLAGHSSWPTVRLMDHLLMLARPRTGIEKSPDSTLSDQALEDCLRAYPDARFIHLTRHPVATQRSMHAHFGRLGRYNDSELVLLSAAAWYRAHLRIARRLAALPPERWRRVRAEDLLREPGTWLPRICAWLGLPCDAAIVSRMRQTERWPFAGWGPAGALGGGDARFLCSPALRPVAAPGPVEFDPAWELPDDLVKSTTRLATLLGY